MNEKDKALLRFWRLLWSRVSAAALQKAQGVGIAQAMGAGAQAIVNHQQGVPPEQVERIVLAAAQGRGIEYLPSVSVPPLPANFILRPDALDALCEKLLDHAQSQEQIIALTAVSGMGGIGKTVLAQALCGTSG